MSAPIELVNVSSTVVYGAPALELSVRNVGSKRCQPSVSYGTYAANGDVLHKDVVPFSALEPGEQGVATLAATNLHPRTARTRLLAIEWHEGSTPRSVMLNRDCELQGTEATVGRKGRKVLLAIGLIIAASMLATVITSLL